MEIAFVGFLLLLVVTIFLMVFLNEPFWQGYRNSKFIDEMMKEEEEEFSNTRNVETK